VTYICPECGHEVERETDMTKPGLVMGDADTPAHRCPACEVTYSGVDLPEV